MSTRRFTAIAAFQQIFCRENPKAVFPIEIVGVKLFSALKNFAHLCYMKFKGTIPIQKIDELNGIKLFIQREDLRHPGPPRIIRGAGLIFGISPTTSHFPFLAS